MRLLLDMNLSPRWVEFLVEAGHDAIHWSSIGAPDARDSEIMAFAREEGCCLLTNDLDFPQILAHAKDDGPSIVLLRGEPLTPEVRCTSVLAALQACEAELDMGAVLSLDLSGQPRAKLLPLR